MNTGYYGGCRITLRRGSNADQLLSKIADRIATEYKGVELTTETGAAPGKVEAWEVCVPTNHPLSNASVVDENGNPVPPTGRELILARVMDIVREEEKLL